MKKIQYSRRAHIKISGEIERLNYAVDISPTTRIDLTNGFVFKSHSLSAPDGYRYEIKIFPIKKALLKNNII